MKHLKLIPLIFILSSCANLVCNFDQNSYDSAMSLKAYSLNLISNADTSAGLHEAEIRELQSKLAAQLAYERAKSSNKISADQWETLVSPNADLLGKMLKQWIENVPFTKPYIQEKSIQIGLAFDQILALEGSKSR